MKRVFIIFIIFSILLSSCNKKENLDFDISTIKVDMSAYGIDNSNEIFKETTVSELTRTLKEGGSGVFYLGYKECPHCQICIPYLYEIASEMNVTIYYLNATDENGKYTIVGELFDELYDDIYEILDEDEDGNKSVYTPHVFSIIKGKFSRHKISCEDEDEKDIIELKKDYQKILEPFRK